jgi:hypothetical protein
MLRLLKCKLSIRGLLSALNAKDVGNGQACSPSIDSTPRRRLCLTPHWLRTESPCSTIAGYKGPKSDLFDLPSQCGRLERKWKTANFLQSLSSVFITDKNGRVIVVRRTNELLAAIDYQLVDLLQYR